MFGVDAVLNAGKGLYDLAYAPSAANLTDGELVSILAAASINVYYGKEVKGKDRFKASWIELLEMGEIS